jgi:transposase
MSYRKTAKLSNLRGGQDGRKGHNHGNTEDLKRLHVIHKVIEGELTQGEAAKIISLSKRQIRRIIKRIREEGDREIQHRSRGKESNSKLPKKLVEKIIELYRQKYKGFGPTFTSEG